MVPEPRGVKTLKYAYMYTVALKKSWCSCLTEGKYDMAVELTGS